MSNAWSKVELVRHVDRPNSLDYINLIFTDFIELHGDRQFGDDKAMVCGIAKFESTPVTIISQQKGKNTKEKAERNFGMPHPEGYRKALRLMKQAEKFNRPIVCFVDTTAAYPGIGAEERGQGEAIARNLMEMSNLSVPIISIILGEGGSGGALAIAVADEVWMLENSIYSVLPPEGLANILWKDGTKAKEAAELMKMTAEDLKQFGIIDKIIKEKKGGVHKDIQFTINHIKQELRDSLKKLNAKTKSELVQNRYAKYRKMGEVKNIDNK